MAVIRSREEDARRAIVRLCLGMGLRVRPNGPGVPEFGARMNMASAYAKLPQMQPGYFAVSPGGNVDHSVTNNVVHHKTDVHVDGSQDPKSRRAWSARISIGPTKT
jgi:hypothetical protein